MQVTVKLFASLGAYLPPDAQRHAMQVEVADDTTVGQLLRQLNLPIELTHLVLLNGTYVEPQNRENMTLSPGDEFAVFPPVAGG
jgi:molybdopterin converting factor small subunit